MEIKPFKMLIGFAICLMPLSSHAQTADAEELPLGALATIIGFFILIFSFFKFFIYKNRSYNAEPTKLSQKASGSTRGGSYTPKKAKKK